MFDGKPTSQSLRPHPGACRGAPSDVVQLRVVLIEIIPPSWRRLQVPVHLTLRRFHAVLQEVMGWKNLQPHRFRVGAAVIGKPSDPSDALKDSRWLSVQDVLDAGVRTFHYEYGAGGDWVIEIRIEDRKVGTADNQRPIRLSGERAWPPEDVNGPEDYVERLAGWEGRFRQPGFRPERGSPFDPEKFDVNQVNAALSALPS